MMRRDSSLLAKLDSRLQEHFRTRRSALDANVGSGQAKSFLPLIMLLVDVVDGKEFYCFLDLCPSPFKKLNNFCSCHLSPATYGPADRRVPPSGASNASICPGRMPECRKTPSRPWSRIASYFLFRTFRQTYLGILVLFLYCAHRGFLPIRTE